MSALLLRLFSQTDTPNSVHPFVPLSDTDTYADIEARMLSLKASGIRSMVLLWSSKKGMDGLTKRSPFDVPEYWERIGWIVELCRRHTMTFFVQDAAPFPTGQADGLLKEPENLNLNKLYLAQRHLDVAGPNADASFRVDMLSGALQLRDLSAAPVLPGNTLLAVVAMRRNGDVADCSTAIDVTSLVRDGILYWPVPEGIWRVFVLYETRNGGGRPHYMNLLDAESVALNIRAVHEPHYQRLQGEAGKTWLGFFYDEPEVGNLGGYVLNATLGAPGSLSGESMALPWSREMPALLRETWGKAYAKLLPLLWYHDESEYHRVRCGYMDVVSRLIQENYNGQMHGWCRERNILYIGHCLEDENSHCRLGCGPVHYFRMQKHQDAAGVDLVGNQLMPGKDFTHAWYGCEDGDGAFYQYVLAKLASSAAHIDAGKRGRSFCEVFAVYGALAGTRLSKYILDHLMVYGVNMIVPALGRIEGFVEAHAQRLYTYVNRMCCLMRNARARIQVALLYHAEAEWYQGRRQLVETPARELAKGQLSYDVIPADVFEDRAYYQTDGSAGLEINGNRYEALVVPGCDALPKAAAAFLAEAEQSGFPVFFCDDAPVVIAETGKPFAPGWGRVVPTGELASVVGGAIRRDIRTATPFPALRCARFDDADGAYYFLHNQGGATSNSLWIPGDAPIYQVDMEERNATALSGSAGDGGTWLTIEMAEFEALLLFSGDMKCAALPAACWERRSLDARWTVTLENGTTLALERLVNLNGERFYPRYAGTFSYECVAHWERIPRYLELGAVYEACEVYVNGQFAGARQSSPYRVRIDKAAKMGENRLRIDVKPNTACALPADPLTSLTAIAYNPLDPGGLLGPVNVVYEN